MKHEPHNIICTETDKRMNRSTRWLFYRRDCPSCGKKIIDRKGNQINGHRLIRRAPASRVKFFSKPCVY